MIKGSHFLYDDDNKVSANIILIIRREMGQLITYSPYIAEKATDSIDYILDIHLTEYIQQAIFLMAYHNLSLCLEYPLAGHYKSTYYHCYCCK